MERRRQLLIDHYTTELAKMLSDQDFARYGMRDKIIKYSELANYRNINELLTEPFDYRIILVESDYNTGHWTCIIKYKNIIESFNSYGTKPSYDFKFIPAVVRRSLGQRTNQIIELLKTKTPDQQVYYNKKQLQKINDRVNTCGRWCICRIMMAQCGYELDDFIAKLESVKRDTGKPFDIIVCDWIK